MASVNSPTGRQLDVLTAIETRNQANPDGKITLALLGSDLDLAGCTVHQHLSALESRGWIERQPGKVVRLTKAGRKFLL
jgi:DNA-binding MarR family transcriptional regulator